MKLPGSAVWEPKITVYWEPAIKLPRSAVWEHCAKKWTWNCQGLQFENIDLIMDESNGRKASMKMLYPKSFYVPKNILLWRLAVKSFWKSLERKICQVGPKKFMWNINERLVFKSHSLLLKEREGLLLCCLSWAEMVVKISRYFCCKVVHVGGRGTIQIIWYTF